MNEVFKIEKRVLSLDVYGEKYDLKIPSSKMKNDFNIEFNKIESDEQYEYMVVYLEKLGLPKDVAYEIEDGDILEVFNILHSKKKK